MNDLAGVLKDFDRKRAESYVNQALTLAERIAYKRGIQRSYQIMGILHLCHGHPDTALKTFFKALEICQEIKYRKGIANAYCNIGTAYDTQARNDMAIDCYLKALKIYKEIGDNTWVCGCYGNIAVLYMAAADYERALEIYLKTINILEHSGDNEQLALAFVNIGTIYNELNIPDESMEYLSRGLDIAKEINNREILALCYNSLGRTLVSFGNYVQALEYCAQSLKIYEELDTRQGIAQSCIDLGSIYRKLKRYDEALRFINRGLWIAKDDKEKRQERDGYQELFELYEAQQIYEKALFYYKKCTHIKDEIFNTEKSRQIASMRIKYETERKDKESEIYRLKNVKLRREIRQRKKAEKQLQEHRDHLEELVAERTSKLEKEITERKKIEQTLLNSQKQLRSLAREISLIEEKQRRKFATFLHDDINQALALATFKLRAVQEKKPGKNNWRELNEIKKIIDKTAERTRTLAFEISPPILYELGLEPALEWLVRRFGEQYRVKCKFKDDGAVKPLTDDARVFLFQSVREILANVAKHAQAKSVKISTHKDNNSLCITVEDDGIGFNPATLGKKIAKNESFGLFNIKERLRHIKGTLEIHSKKGKGAKVVIHAPLVKKRERKKKR